MLFGGIGDYFQDASPGFLEKLLEQYKNGKWEDILEKQFRNYLAYSDREFEGKPAVEIWLQRLKILALLSSKNASSIVTAFESIDINIQEDKIFVMDALTSVIEFGNVGLLRRFTKILGGDERVRQQRCQDELLRAAASVARAGNFAMVQPVMDLTQEGDLDLIEEEILRSADLGLARDFFENTAFYSTGFIPSERNILIAVFSGNIALLETPNSVAILSLLRGACGEDKEAASPYVWPEFFYETIKYIITYPEKFALDNNQVQLLLSLLSSSVAIVQEGMQREGAKENFAYVFIHKQNVLEDFKKWEREFNLSHSSLSENTSTTFSGRKRKRSITPSPTSKILRFT